MWETRTGRKQHNLVFADRNYVCDYMHMSVEVRSDHKLSQETHFDVRCVEYRVDHTWSVPSGWILIPGLNKARYTQQSSLPQKGAVLACWCLAAAAACWLGQWEEGQGCLGPPWWGSMRWRRLDLGPAGGADSAGWMHLGLEWAASRLGGFSARDKQAYRH